MRCNNCGWENPAGLTKCEKCGASLVAGAVKQSNAMSGTAIESTAGTAAQGSNVAPAFSKTVREVSVFGDEATPVSQSDHQKNDGRCPKCGYPLRPGVSICPKCHNAINQNESKCGNDYHQTGNPAHQSTERELIIGQQHQMTESSYAGNERPKQQKNFGGTVMPGMNITPEIWFSLTPIAISGERETPAKVEFEGMHHELNRENVDPKNHTITSKVQAVMDYDTEKKIWYIQDKSAMQYTFLHCEGEMPVINGDVILMGDRKFILKVEENTVSAEPQQFTGTIAVGHQRNNAPRCTLIPVVDDGEVDAPKAQVFRGDAHQLNRANLDPENYTITSKVQAELTHDNGQWYIKDCSQMQTTYILCQDPMDLKDGDRILMGNRLFTFNC